MNGQVSQGTAKCKSTCFAFEVTVNYASTVGEQYQQFSKCATAPISCLCTAFNRRKVCKRTMCQRIKQPPATPKRSRWLSGGQKAARVVVKESLSWKLLRVNIGIGRRIIGSNVYSQCVWCGRRFNGRGFSLRLRSQCVTGKSFGDWLL